MTVRIQDRGIVAVRGADGSGLSEHAVHHFHGMVLAAYRRGAGAS